MINNSELIAYKIGLNIRTLCYVGQNIQYIKLNYGFGNVFNRTPSRYESKSQNEHYCYKGT